MIVGCYELHLYCDTIRCIFGGATIQGHAPGQFTGDNQREAMGKARRAGWSFAPSSQASFAYCPACTKKGRT